MSRCLLCMDEVKASICVTVCIPCLAAQGRKGEARAARWKALAKRLRERLQDAELGRDTYEQWFSMQVEICRALKSEMGLRAAQAFNDQGLLKLEADRLRGQRDRLMAVARDAVACLEKYKPLVAVWKSSRALTDALAEVEKEESDG